jgi:hypothetical protein
MRSTFSLTRVVLVSMMLAPAALIVAFHFA